jgi:hypothetical protein
MHEWLYGPWLGTRDTQQSLVERAVGTADAFDAKFDAFGEEVRKAPSWPRSWPNFGLL